MEEFGSLTIWVNNAGGSRMRKPMIEQTRDEWEQSLALNLSAVWSCTKIAARHDASGVEHGAILNISSLAAYGPVPKSGHYAAAKAAVNSLTETFAVETRAPDPGQRHLTGSGADRGDDGRARAQGRPARRPARRRRASRWGRLGTPEDIGQCALYLCSPAEAWVTGQTIKVTGGR